MFFYDGNEFFGFFFAVEDFSLPELHIFLKIKSRFFGDTKIFGGIGNGQAHFFGQPEKMIYGIVAGKNYGRMIQNIDFFPSELLS